MKNFEETFQWICKELPMFSKIGINAYNEGLGNISKFMQLLDNPQNKFKSIHVAGTNGKGSTSHMLASIFQSQGYKTGLYTSPHLKIFTERIKINKDECSKQFVVSFVEKYQSEIKAHNLSFFELTTAMAFEYFAKQNVDFAIIEVGLGGRLDATNIIQPILSVITNVHYDHQEILGNTLDKIAFEKGGIIKNLIPVVLGDMETEAKQTLLKLAKERGSKVFEYERQFNFKVKNYNLDLNGNYQKINLKTVLSAINALKNYLKIELDEKKIKIGLENVVKNTNLRGRWEILNEKPFTVCDTAHNEDGISQIVKQLHDQKFNKLHLVLGFVKDKDFEKIISLFPKNAKYYFCEPNLPRKLPVEEIKNFVRNTLEANYFKSAVTAFENAKENAKEDDFIFVGGSNYVVAEII